MPFPALSPSEVGHRDGVAGIKVPVCGFCGAEAVLAYERFDWFEHRCHEYSRWIEKWADRKPRPGQAVVPLLAWNKDGSPMNGSLSPKDLAMLFLDGWAGRRRSGDWEPNIARNLTPDDGHVPTVQNPEVA